MSSYGWADAPATVRAQIEGLLHALQATIGRNVVGFYMHGSLAMGCFNPLCSDLDLLAVTGEGMPVAAKRRVAGILLDRSRAPHPIEISFLRRRDLSPWRFPTPYDFHYSEDWRGRLQAAVAGGSWREWNAHELRDPDLAAHITITRQRGIRLSGPPIADVFPPVPPTDYVASIIGDFADARDAIVEHPVYAVLNLCRVYHYLLDGRISSKEEAGAWAVATMPAAFRPIVRQALALYRSTAIDERFALASLTAFARYMDERVHALSDQTVPGS